MNLENLYGSHRQLMEVFESALQQNEPIEVFTRLVVIYEESNKMEVSRSYCVPPPPHTYAPTPYTNTCGNKSTAKGHTHPPV